MVLRLGDQTLEAPISGNADPRRLRPDIAAGVRVANTLIGTVVGIAFSLVVPVAIPNPVPARRCGMSPGRRRA
jgi:hypothetical protein